jgi:hypothetical protein
VVGSQWLPEGLVFQRYHWPVIRWKYSLLAL